MSILDINQKRKKLQIIKIMSVYLSVAILCIVINKIYAAFGHGVSADAMTWMFLYPLMGGILFFPLSGIMIPRISQFSGFRTFSNIYNSGVATLTVGSFLRGIMDIAGTSSRYVIIYYQIGWFLIGCSIILQTVHKYSKGHDIV